MTGSFLLTDQQKDLEELFQIDEEVVTYHTKEELLSKITFYKDNYEAYLKHKENRLKQLRSEFSNQQKKIAQRIELML